MSWMFAALLLGAAALPPQDDEAWQVTVAQRDGEAWVTLRASRASARELLTSLALKHELRLEGLELLPQDDRVSVDLRDRPTSQVLQRVLGQFGLTFDLRTRSVVIRAQAAHEATVETLRDQAQAQYLRTLRAHGEHVVAPLARKHQATIEEQRGDRPAALVHWDTIIQRHRESPVLPEALMRAGELLMSTREWGAAAQRFTELLRLDRRHAFEISARVALARCMALLGDHERTLYMLDVIDTYDPALEPRTIQERLYLKVRAFVDAHRAVEALQLLRRADELGTYADLRVEGLELEARVQDSLGEHLAASKAWLVFSREVAGPDRQQALLQAARAARDAGDHLGVLFVAGLGDESTENETLAELAGEARRALDLAETPESDASLERLERAERLASASRFGEAVAAYEVVALDRLSLAAEERVRFWSGFARALDRSAGVDAAVARIATAVDELVDAEERRQMFVLAGELLEAHLRLEDAIEAYQGRLP